MSRCYRWSKTKSRHALNVTADCEMLLLYWAVAVLVIVDHFRRGRARFKLGAHFLDLSCLLFELDSENLYFFLLPCGRCLHSSTSRFSVAWASGAPAAGGLNTLRRSARIGSSSDQYRAQSYIGTDEHESTYRAQVINRRIVDVPDPIPAVSCQTKASRLDHSPIHKLGPRYGPQLSS
jgi:hypothetical protein